MKKILLLLPILFFACSKPDDLLSLPEPSSIEFKFDNSLKTYKTVGSAKLKAQSVYNFIGTKEPKDLNYFEIGIYTDSLKPGTYKADLVTFRDGNIGAGNVMNENVFVHIISNKNGYVNGTFTGTVYNLETCSTSTMTAGKINNIRVNYY